MANQTVDPEREKMRRWRNVMCPDSEPDAEIRAIDAVEQDLGKPDAIVTRIRALISRIDSLSHYKAFENIDFLMDAIGDLDYPGSPAVDVLWRNGQVDDARRALAKAYADALGVWLSGKPLPSAQRAQPDSADLLARVYEALGQTNEEKRWLAMCLRKTLKEQAYTPWDFIAEYHDAAFVYAVYEAILGRPPSGDDLAFRIEELLAGKSREAFVTEIMGTDEHRRGHLFGIVAHLKHREAN